MIGFFVNVVALRARWSDAACFRDVLGGVQAAARDALRHQSLPFEHVLEAIGAARRVDQVPLTPFGFALERAAADVIRLPGVELTTLRLERVTSRTDLALIVGDGGHRVTVRVEHDAARMDATTARALLDDFVTVLDRIAVDPDGRLASLPPGVAAPRGSRCGPEAAETLWPAFVAHVRRTPAAVAVRAGDVALTYAELAAAAERVADVLRAAGVARQAVVAVWGERGVHLASSLLGIIRAGAVYLPIDPRWPAARVTQVLRQSGVGVLLAPADVPPEVGSGPWRVLVLDQSADVPADAGTATTAATGRGGDAAYVLYTSGSTGAPKGAVIAHAALTNHVRAKIALLDLGPEDRVAQTAAAGFDISLWQHLAAWAAGGAVVVLDDATVRDPERLCAAVATAGVTVWQVVPAVLRLVLEADTAATGHGFPHLRWLVATGEALPPELCRAWLTRFPHVPIVNAYGPTECADDVAHHVLRAPPAPDMVRVPIGTPIDGVALHVLDEALRPVPTGDVGELCVSGVAVGSGYLHDPARTAAAFVATGETGRLYRTGDRARVLPDGTFECLGRCDQQIKIRGVRVEPEEVEAVLRRHPAVRAAIVVPRPGSDGSSRLVACVVATALPVSLAEDLRRHVADRLPDAMVPTSFELHAALPLTSNGKVDRAALASTVVSAAPRSVAGPHPSESGSGLAGTFLEIWRDVLGVDVRSVDADFFALGGDSLAAIRVVASVRRHGFVITPRQVFEERTIARLVAVATPCSADAVEQGLVLGRVEPTPVQRMFLESDLEGRHHYNLAMLLEADGPLVSSCLHVAVEHLMRQHDILRVRWHRHGSAWRQTIGGLEGPVPFTRIDLSDVEDADAVAAIERTADEMQATLDLTDGPMFRVVAFDLGPSRASRVLVIVHHLACDVASWPILLEDLATVYGQLRDGAPIALPAKTTSYRAWARSAVAAVPDRATELAFWRHECADGGSRLPCAVAEAPPAIADVARVRLALGPRETAAVLAAAAERGVTVEAFVLTGVALAVTAEVGGDAVLVYLERHGREALGGGDVSRTVGWFTAVFPFRVPVASSGCPEASLVLVDQHLRAVPHGGVGYGLLRYAGGELADAVRALPRPEISVNYLGRIDPPAGAGWRLAREAPGREVGVRGSRPTALDVTAHVAGGRLHVEWAFDRVRHGSAFIATLGERTLDVVRGFAVRRSEPALDVAEAR